MQFLSLFKQSESTVHTGKNSRIHVTTKHAHQATIYPLGDEELKAEDVIGLDLTNLPKLEVVEMP